MAKLGYCPNHPSDQASKECMDCGKAFCFKCLRFEGTRAFCNDCFATEETVSSVEGEEGVEGAASGLDEDTPVEEVKSGNTVLAAGGDEGVQWESAFNSADMIQISRNRLALLQGTMPLEDHQAGFFSRLIAWIIDIGIILGLTFGFHHLVFEMGVLNTIIDPSLLEGEDPVFFAVTGHFAAALIYYRLPFILYGGGTLGRIVCGIRVVNEKGGYLTFGQAFLYTVLSGLADLFLFIPRLINGLTALFSKNHRGLISNMCGAQVVKVTPWQEIAKRFIFKEDVYQISK